MKAGKIMFIFSAFFSHFSGCLVCFFVYKAIYTVLFSEIYFQCLIFSYWVGSDTIDFSVAIQHFWKDSLVKALGVLDCIDGESALHRYVGFFTNECQEQVNVYTKCVFITYIYPFTNWNS